MGRNSQLQAFGSFKMSGDFIVYTLSSDRVGLYGSC